MACGGEDIKRPCATCGTCPTCGYGRYRGWWGGASWPNYPVTYPQITWAYASTTVPNCTCNNIETCPHRNQGTK